jgi:hypothetical protein
MKETMKDGGGGRYIKGRKEGRRKLRARREGINE